ncbi:MAG: hypothetical protein HC913_10475 [Microscillaceae bacterium]|nr:hypothetical protein [Microscillaceae bacterium]
MFKTELRHLQACIDAFENLPQPKIAKIEGYCIGGGLILAACCDLRVAEEKAVFSLPEIRMGIAVIMGTQRITRLAGIAATKEMILLADKFNASKAEDYGLLHKVVSPAQLRRQVEEWADRFRELPPRTLQIAKQIIDAGQHLSLLESQALEAELQASLSGSYDWAEAVHSHFEKRKPNFKGK